nr:hydroxymethylbilane synthase [Thermoguttaceae bacterium]
MTLRIGTRSSALALWQAERVRSELEKYSVETEIVRLKTAGDRNRSDSILNLGAQGVFAKEIQRALLDGRIDLAVHSLKDLPV